jgi:uncharacterized protein HemX
METWMWIVIAVVAVLVVAGVAFLVVQRSGERKVEQKREEAEGLRHEAEERRAQAGRREATAEQEARRAERERAASEDALSRADEIDPDVR